MRRPLGSVVVLMALFAGRPTGVEAQRLPSEPFVFGDGRVVVGGDVSLTVSCSHAARGAACTSDTGFFNYSDYDDSLIRMARLGLSTAVRLTDQLSALADLRTENAHAPRPYGLYLRFKPFDARNFDIQAGRIPTAFGAFARRAYSTDNLLIGYPLAYQYLTSLRADAVPATADDLIRMRGRGWLASFPIGDPTPAAGLPLVNALRWDTGVQVHGGTSWLEGVASVTTGSLSNPLVLDDNHGRNLSGRVLVKPATGLTIGTSAARAPYATSDAASAARSTDERFTQLAFGVDAEYSRDHYLVRVESVMSRYNVPTIASRLRAAGTMVEGRYKVTPRLHAAARFDHLAFSRIRGTVLSTTWEAPVTRWEVGTGYSLQRNTQVRLSFQRNTREGGRVQRLSAAAAQLLYWF